MSGIEESKPRNPPRNWTSKDSETPTRNITALQQEGLLGSHIGTVSAKKAADATKLPLDPKYRKLWVIMTSGNLTTGMAEKNTPKNIQDFNQSIFSSLIGFAVSGICPIWRKANMTLNDRETKTQWAVRTKYLRDFNTLLDVCGGDQNQYHFDQLNKLTAKKLAEKQVPTFLALAKTLGNYDLPARNWAYSGKKLTDDGHFRMTDVDASGRYAELKETTLTSPATFPAEAHYPRRPDGGIYADTPTYHENPDDPLRRTAAKEQAFKNVTTKLETLNCQNQYFQVLFAATLLPDAWIDSLAKQYLIDSGDPHQDLGSFARAFQEHRNNLYDALKNDGTFQAALAKNRDAWITQALAHMEKFNLHEGRKHPERWINLEEVMGVIREYYPRETPSGVKETKGSAPASDDAKTPLSSEEGKLIQAGRAQGRDLFLRTKAREYLETLEGETRFSLRTFPKTARTILADLKSGKPMDWQNIFTQLNNSLATSSWRRKETTTETYNKLLQLIQNTPFPIAATPSSTTVETEEKGTFNAALVVATAAGPAKPDGSLNAEPARSADPE